MIIFPLSTLASFVPFSSFQHIYFSVFLDMGMFSDFYLSVFFYYRVCVVYWWRHIFDLSIYIHCTVHNIYTCSFHMYSTADFGLLFIISCIDNDEIRL